MPPEFAITEQSIDAERHVLAVRGEIDLFTAPELKQVLAESIESGRNYIVVDLTETTFLDSTALGVLIEARTRLPNRRGNYCPTSSSGWISLTLARAFPTFTSMCGKPT